MTVDHPQFGTMCEVCFRALIPENCAVDTDGQTWDVCAGRCAREAGIEERDPPDIVDGVSPVRGARPVIALDDQG